MIFQGKRDTWIGPKPTALVPLSHIGNHGGVLSVGFTITFDSQGGSVVTPQIISTGALVTEPTDPVYEGYIFDGWYHDGRYSEPWVFATDTISMDTQIYAKWTEVIYTVTFDSQGGSAIEGQAVGYGQFITEPIAPTRALYMFSGWYKEVTCTNTWVFTSDTITGNRTLYAKWANS